MNHKPTYEKLAARVRELERVEDEYRCIEDTLKKERERLSRMMETSHASIVHVNAEGRVIYANKPAENILGLQLNKESSRTYDDPEWKHF